MKTPEEKEVAELKLTQLRRLADRSLDKPIAWMEIRAVETPFFDSYTSKDRDVRVRAGRELVERVRGHAMFELWKELKGLGYIDEVEEILTRPQPPEPKPTLR